MSEIEEPETELQDNEAEETEDAEFGEDTEFTPITSGQIPLAIPNWKGQYVIREQFRPIAEQLVNKYPELRHIQTERILFVADTTGTGKIKDKRKKAQIGAMPVKWTEILHQITRQWFTWMMEFFTMNCSGLRHEQYVALVYHELRHIGLDGKPCCHDVEDWQEMIDALGLNWSSLREEGAEFPDLLDPGVDWDRLMGQKLVQMSIDNLSEHVKGFKEVLQGDDSITGIGIEGAGRKLSIVK
jgi:hypothetical protein